MDINTIIPQMRNLTQGHVVYFRTTPECRSLAEACEPSRRDAGNSQLVRNEAWSLYKADRGTLVQKRMFDGTMEYWFVVP